MTNSIQSPLDAALAHHQAGRLPQAEQAYRQILAQNPNDPDALHLLGLLAHQAGHTAAGIEHIERAIALKPDPQFFSNLAEIYRAAGQIDRGIACCQRAIELAPNLGSAYINLAALLQAANRAGEAYNAARRAVELSPQDGSAHRVLGNLLLALGRLDEANVSLQNAVQRNPQDAAAWTNLGILNARLGKPDVSAQCHFRAMQISPQNAEILNNLGQALAICGRHADAANYLQQAVKINPDMLEAQENLAACLEQLNRFAESVALCKTLIARNPARTSYYCIMANALMYMTDLEGAEAALRQALKYESNPDLHQILSVCLTRMGRVDEAIAEINIAIAMRPNWVEGHFSKALILMFAGRYDEAWPCYEWRWQHPRMDRWRHKTDKPQWDGSLLNGKCILLYGEQGLGDTLQASRYATLVAQRGGHVILEVQDGLRQLAQSIEGVKEVIVRGEPVPPFETHAAVMSLPGIFKTSLQTIPNKVPYITSDPAKVEKWREILGDADGKLKVGIAWEGGAFLRENFLRSATLAEFAPLAAVPNVRFYSLQKGPAARQIQQPPAGMDIVDLDAKIFDFSDTAAIIANMDVLIAVDTAVVHVAGGRWLGRSGTWWPVTSAVICG